MPPRRPKSSAPNLGFYSGTITRQEGKLWLIQDTARYELVSRPLKVAAPGAKSPTALAGQEAYVRGIRKNNKIEVHSAFAGAIPVKSRFSQAQKKQFDRVRRAIERNRAQLMSYSGVIGVRAGYQYKNGWSTSRAAIVVTVLRKIGAPYQPLPDKIDGVPVDVTPATPQEQLAYVMQSQSLGPTRLAALADALPAPEPLALPDWQSYPDAGDVHSFVAEAFAGVASRLVAYQPPQGVTLDPVDEQFSLICHTSPDVGWPTLQAFLDGISQRLTLAMYDFTAPHIVKELQQVFANRTAAKLSLILDPGESLTAPGGDSNNPKAGDIHETEVRDDLEQTLGNRFAFEWAAVKRTGKTTQGIFPSAYHIKLAVRDGSSFWHSSGNWQSSNQPDLAPLTDPTVDLKNLFATFNREWHLVVTNPTLASVFERFILADIAEAKPLQAGASPVAVPSFMMPDAGTESLVASLAVSALRLFQPLNINGRKFKIQPLLTPDNFVDHVIPLIQSAQNTLFLQNQYIKIPKKAAQQFLDLLNAVLARIKAGVDVKIIVRDLPDTRAQLEALEAFGFDMSHFKVQTGCHNKGIVVDSSVVLVGSHNWSNDGVLRNRDASQIIFDPEVAQLYEQIFLHDWNNVARTMTLSEAAMPVLNMLPQGFHSVSLSDLFD